MSLGGAWQGWYGQQASVPAYPQGPYGQAPPPAPVLMYGPPPVAPGAFPLAQFGEKRMAALIGGIIAVIGLFAPWLDAFIMSINAFGMVSLAGLLANAPGGAYGLVIGAIVAIVGVLVGAPLPLVRNT